MSTDKTEKTPGQHGFLPDFCNIRMVFAVIVLAELIAIALLLTTPYHQPLAWDRLGTLSLFIQWIALASIGLLCMLRKYLGRLGDISAGIISYIIVLLVTLLVSELAYRLMLEPWFEGAQYSHQDFLMRTLAVSAILSGIILRVIYLQHQQKLHIQANAEARIQALQARIRPHFLFNSMNTIAALIRTDPEHAEAAVEDLSDLFRASLGQNARFISLADEVGMARRYLQIEQLRLGERLRVDWQIDSLPMHARLPVLTLQPLLENAIFHGIEMVPGGGEIVIHGDSQDDMIVLTITNPCLPQDQARRSGGNRMAMDNINERLQIAYGKQAGLGIRRFDDHCELELRFPVREQA